MRRERIQSTRKNIRLSFFKVSDNSIFKKIDLQKKKKKFEFKFSVLYTFKHATLRMQKL